MEQKYWETSHLFSRAGFGATHREIVAHMNKPWVALVDMVLDPVRVPRLDPPPDLSPDRDWYQRWVEMVHYWLDRATRPVTRGPIVEKMVLFWHGHLCSGLQKVADHQMMFDQNQLFRTKGMGDFRTLLWEVSVGPAMLRYLDNEHNTATEVNENFSRELMELFVTGFGHFDESDVGEAARAWTGHGIDRDGRYKFSAAQHDGASKLFLGQRGNWTGKDIVNLLLNHRRHAHAQFLAAKLWSFFAYPVSVDDPVVADVAAAYRPRLNIRDALRAIFLHPAFRSNRAMQGLVRSPIEYVVAVMRHTGTRCSEAHPEWYLSTMGQDPFNPPNVSGWRSNEYWISESATWAKGAFAGYVRWRAYSRNDIVEVNKVVSWNPRTFAITPQQAVDRALANYQLRLKSDRSRQALINYVRSERASDEPCGQRAGLLFLPLMTPEMQLA